VDNTLRTNELNGLVKVVRGSKVVSPGVKGR